MTAGDNASVQRYVVVVIEPRFRWAARLMRFLTRRVWVDVYENPLYADSLESHQSFMGSICYVCSFRDFLPGVVQWGREQMEKLERLMDEVNRVAVYMRKAYRREIESGSYPHDSSRSFSEAVIHYLSRERELSGVKTGEGEEDEQP